MALVGDLVLQTANNPGTSTFNLIAPPAARISFVTGCGIGQAYYFASDGTSWEKGIGTVASGSPDTLTRDVVLGNSLGTMAKINFTGALTLLCDVPAERDVWASADNASLLMGGRRASGLGAAIVTDDAAQFGQVADKYVGTYAPSGGLLVVPLANGTDKFKIELRGLIFSGGTQLFARVSVDGGATYLQGTSEYAFQVSRLPNTSGDYFDSYSFIPMTRSTIPYVFDFYGHFEVEPAARHFNGQIQGFQETHLFNGAWSTGSTATHVLFGGVGASMNSGSARLLRKVF